jgi:hypothetical protein
VVILAVDSELKVEASFSSRRNLIAVKGGEDFVERLRLVWVKAYPEGVGGMCLVFINLGQFFSLPCRSIPLCFYSPWLIAVYVKDVKDEFGVKGTIFDVLNVKEEAKFCAMRGEGVKKSRRN